MNQTKAFSQSIICSIAIIMSSIALIVNCAPAVDTKVPDLVPKKLSTKPAVAHANDKTNLDFDKMAERESKPDVAKDEADEADWFESLPAELKKKLKPLDVSERKLVAEHMKTKLGSDNSLSPEERIISTYSLRLHRIITNPVCNPDSLADLTSINKELELVSNEQMRHKMREHLEEVGNDYVARCIDQTISYLWQTQQMIDGQAGNWIGLIDQYANEVNAQALLESGQFDYYIKNMSPNVMASLEFRLKASFELDNSPYSKLTQAAFSNGKSGTCSVTTGDFDKVGSIIGRLFQLYPNHPVVHELIVTDNIPIKKFFHLWTVCTHIRNNYDSSNKKETKAPSKPQKVNNKKDSKVDNDVENYVEEYEEEYDE